MEEEETSSFFAQKIGAGIRGPYSGKQLVNVESSIVRFGEWRKLHPATEVLVGEEIVKPGE